MCHLTLWNLRFYWPVIDNIYSFAWQNSQYGSARVACVWSCRWRCAICSRSFILLLRLHLCFFVLVIRKKKVSKKLCHTVTGNSHAIWDHTVLPATRQWWEFRLFLQPKHVLNLLTPKGCKAELTYVTRKRTGWELNLSVASPTSYRWTTTQHRTQRQNCWRQFWRHWRQLRRYFKCNIVFSSAHRHSCCTHNMCSLGLL